MATSKLIKDIISDYLEAFEVKPVWYQLFEDGMRMWGDPSYYDVKPVVNIYYSDPDFYSKINGFIEFVVEDLGLKGIFPCYSEE